MSEDNKWLTLMKSVSGAAKLSQELIDESVELVKVHEDGSIELVMKYGDIYALTVQSIKAVSYTHLIYCFFCCPAPLPAILPPAGCSSKRGGNFSALVFGIWSIYP